MHNNAVNTGRPCVSRPNAAVQGNEGVVACDDDFVPWDGVHTACGTANTGSAVCTTMECIWCSTGNVVIERSCRSAAGCAETDGLSCSTCSTGSRRKSPTECVAACDCTVYVDGACIGCADGLDLLADGSCAAPAGCTDSGESACRRCADGLYPGATGTRERLLLATDAQRATTHARHARSTRRSA